MLAQISGHASVHPVTLIASGRSGDVFHVQGPMIEHMAVLALSGAPTMPAKDIVMSKQADLMGRTALPSGHAEGVVQQVAIKLQILSDDACEQDVLIEDRVHERVGPVRVAMRRLDGTLVEAAVAPRFVIGATIDVAGSVIAMPMRTVWRVSVMEMLTGTTLAMMDGCVPSVAHRVYGNLERALAALWHCGVAHSDLHPWNVIVLSDQTIRLIDFGLAVTLPRKRVTVALRRALEERSPGGEQDGAEDQAVAAAASSLRPIDRIFDTYCLPHLKRVMLSRGIAWQKCHFDGERLRSLRHALPPLPPTTMTPSLPILPDRSRPFPAIPAVPVVPGGCDGTVAGVIPAITLGPPPVHPRLDASTTSNTGRFRIRTYTT